MERILPEASYISEAMPRLDAFFPKVLLPMLVTGRIQICREGSNGGGIITATNRTNTVQYTHITTHLAHHIKLPPTAGVVEKMLVE